MQAFRRQILRRNTQTMVLGGTSYSWDLQRMSVLRQCVIKLEAVIGTVAATPSIEGFSGAIKSVTLQGTKAGRNYNPVSLLSGRDLYEAYQAQVGTLPSVAALANQFTLASTGYVCVLIPINFDQPRFGAQRYLCCPDMREMTDFNLTITTASQAELDVHTTPTLVFTSLTATVIQEQFDIDTIPKDFFSLDMLMGFKSYDTITTGQMEFQLPAGGNYAYIMARAFATANTRQNPATAPATAVPFNTNNGAKAILYDIGKKPKQEIDFDYLSLDEINRVVDTPVVGTPTFFFNDGTADLFYTGALEKAESYVTLVADMTAATGSKVRFVHQRIFDPMNILKLA